MTFHFYFSLENKREKNDATCPLPPGYLQEFSGDQVEASLLQTLDDLATQSSLDAVGLHSDEGTLHVCRGHRFRSRHGVCRSELKTQIRPAEELSTEAGFQVRPEAFDPPDSAPPPAAFRCESVDLLLVKL